MFEILASPKKDCDRKFILLKLPAKLWSSEAPPNVSGAVLVYKRLPDTTEPTIFPSTYKLIFCPLLTAAIWCQLSSLIRILDKKSWSLFRLEQPFHMAI